MNLLDLCGPLQALATASRRHAGSGKPLYETVVASAAGGLITTSAGLPLMTAAIADLDHLAIDTLIAPGGCKGRDFYAPPALVDWIARRAPDVRRICSVCTGAFLLAAAGQLQGRRAATHWEWAERLRRRHPQVEVDADRIFVRDGAVWTSAGVSAGIDLTLALIEEDYGHQVAIETARQLVMFVKRSGGQSQFSVPLAAQAREGGRFDALHAWVAANLREQLTVERLAEQAGMGARTFARSYASQLGRTPAKMVEAMRLEAACRALENTALPLKTVAASSGYGSEQNLRRVFQRQLGVSPGQYRSRFSGHAGTA
ncbi:GlxA family transcriptional regulator [Massilia sp. Se16.2.3]|uniref:GlxA family transcriptional regulator n=1 Tax=Massilia sp. Se16.2.3 TaxID=2709303 RepID=UPI001603F160|nr:helix-turn-helix domain-containing protein [Massilia sp. Se16.2.3]QNA98324.1 helix-turn-helix domain-containing protein [Massilia sp. Se16.2.3]